MSRWEHRYLGQERFPDALSAMEIEQFFTLGEDEFAAVRRRRRVLNRLALGLQIGFLKMTGGTLNSVEIIPPGVLEHLGRQLGCAPPRIASIRALYRRRRTLFDHQAAALSALGRTEPSEHAERGLVAYLRREAAAVFDNAELMARSRSWLVDHDYLLRRERDIRRLVSTARRHQERTLFKAIVGLAGPDRETWLPRLLAPITAGGISRLDWLGSVPSGKGPTSLEEQIEKVGFLKQLGADRLALSDLPLVGLKHFARRMMSRKAAALARIKDPHRTIEIACFLRLRLLQLSEALDRFGSAAAGDPVYEAGDALGKLLRTLYLCDYFGNPVFRLEILDLLNQGEAVHSLQRAVYNGVITAKHGRTMEELGAISGALTLLANIVMAWNTHRLQLAVDQVPGEYPDEVLKGIAPIGYKHINLRGILTFDLSQLGPSLLGRPAAVVQKRASG